jgi:hypothetical protein
MKGRFLFSGSFVGGCFIDATRWDSFVSMKLRIVAVECRAIRANDFAFVTHVEEDVWMIERRIRTDAHEFLHADFNGIMASVILEVWDDVIGHDTLRCLWIATFY